jgi:predicted SAM-dependent methyltransferase
MEQVREERCSGLPPRGGRSSDQGIVFRLYNRSSLAQKSYRALRRQCSRWLLGRAVREQLRMGGSLRVIIGANRKVQRGWIGTEIYNLNILHHADWARYFSPQSIDALLAEHVWEHLTPEQGRRAAELCFDYLKPGGYLRLAVPDGCFPEPDYIEYVRPGGNGPSADDHKVIYTEQSLAAVLKSAGFTVSALEYYSESGEFCARDWSTDDGYIERSTKNPRRRWFGSLQYTSLVVDAVKPLS